MSDSLTIHSFALKKMGNSLKKISSFHHVFDSFSLFFPFLCPRENCSHRSSLCRSFLNRDRSNSLSSLFTKKRPQGICSHRSLAKQEFALWKRENHYFALLLTKTSDSLIKPKRELPTLENTVNEKVVSYMKIPYMRKQLVV